MRWSAATIEAGRREAAAFADPDTRRREKRIGETPLALANKEVQSAFDDLADIIANGREVGHRGLRRLGAHLAAPCVTRPCRRRAKVASQLRQGVAEAMRLEVRQRSGCTRLLEDSSQGRHDGHCEMASTCENQRQVEADQASSGSAATIKFHRAPSPLRPVIL
jgi:hypothetical protein